MADTNRTAAKHTMSSGHGRRRNTRKLSRRGWYVISQNRVARLLLLAFKSPTVYETSAPLKNLPNRAATDPRAYIAKLASEYFVSLEVLLLNGSQTERLMLKLA
jgi:hypothetical protein